MHPVHTGLLNVDACTLVTFKALVEALVPATPALAVYGSWQAAGAAELCIHEYIIWELDHSLTLVVNASPSPVPLAAPTAGMLNAAAIQLLKSGEVKQVPGYAVYPNLPPFASLAPESRLLVLDLLERQQVDLGLLPPPYWNDGGYVTYMITFLTTMILFGNYSEWSAYGSTRLRTPVARRLEYFPVSWRQVGYPGVVPGYRALLGYKLKIVRNGGSSIIVQG